MKRQQARVVALERFFGGNKRRLFAAQALPQLGTGRMTLLLLCLTAIISLGLLFVWCQLQHLSLSYQISKIYQEHKEHLDLNRKLRIELSNLKSLPRLERLALEEYRMAPPQPHQIVIIR